ncbi:MAG TPA: phosphoribosyl-AMP cyclohydrolase [Syntrophales bacterium]|nr:phosphoribosyl-AMP cyclohydrolase [Syntrophales bacterium]HOL58360.1 phosphoribosyl-AMP cyclohydrolase [Syntrophales bacterium]HPO34529.1 phosphoribosyl-AMP cyclohydrolase [Syntrophales bacterium]
MVKPNFEKGGGLIPTIVQDVETGQVLMLAYMNEEAWNRTLETGKATYWSRSRNNLWVKGESSGNVQLVKEVYLDCDEDTVLIKVEQKGKAACHTGYRSCFYRRWEGGKLVVTGEKVFDPEVVYKK